MNSLLFSALVVGYIVGMGLLIRAADCRSERKSFWGRNKSNKVNSGAKFG